MMIRIAHPRIFRYVEPPQIKNVASGLSLSVAQNATVMIPDLRHLNKWDPCAQAKNANQVLLSAQQFSISG